MYIVIVMNFMARAQILAAAKYIHNIELGQVKLDQPTVNRTSELE